jgi:hypothetical protein
LAESWLGGLVPESAYAFSPSIEATVDACPAADARDVVALDGILCPIASPDCGFNMISPRYRLVCGRTAAGNNGHGRGEKGRFAAPMAE